MFSSRELYQGSVEETHDGIVTSPDIHVGCVNDEGHPVSTVRYNITGGNSGPFQVDSLSGTITVIERQTVDYDEGFDFYNFTVDCIDSANTTNRDTVLVSVTIQPVNEFLPELSVQTLSVNVQETLEIGTVIVSTEQPSIKNFSALDRDRGEHGRIRYSISRINSEPDTLQFFKLNSTTGALTVVRSLDLDVNSNLSLTITVSVSQITVRITACDRDDRESRDQCPNLVVLLHIESVNEFEPRFSQSVYETSVAESAELGTIIIELNCMDRDKGRGSFQQVRINEDESEQNCSFGLKNNSVILINSLDFEASRVHNISLICYDNDDKNSTARLIVHVTAVNEDQPHFTQDRYEFTVNRASLIGKDFGQVVAVDSDQVVGGEITYTLGGDTTNFGIRLDGIIYLASNIFTLEGDSFTLLVTASDGEFNDTAQVHVSVIGYLNAPEIAMLIIGIVLLLVILTLLVLFCIFCRARFLHW